MNALKNTMSLMMGLSLTLGSLTSYGNIPRSRSVTGLKKQGLLAEKNVGTTKTPGLIASQSFEGDTFIESEDVVTPITQTEGTGKACIDCGQNLRSNARDASIFKDLKETLVPSVKLRTTEIRDEKTPVVVAKVEEKVTAKEEESPEDQEYNELACLSDDLADDSEGYIECLAQNLGEMREKSRKAEKSKSRKVVKSKDSKVKYERLYEESKEEIFEDLVSILDTEDSKSIRDFQKRVAQIRKIAKKSDTRFLSELNRFESTTIKIANDNAKSESLYNQFESNLLPRLEDLGSQFNIAKEQGDTSMQSYASYAMGQTYSQANSLFQQMQSLNSPSSLQTLGQFIDGSSLDYLTSGYTDNLQFMRQNMSNLRTMYPGAFNLNQNSNIPGMNNPIFADGGRSGRGAGLPPPIASSIGAGQPYNFYSNAYGNNMIQAPQANLSLFGSAGISGMNNSYNNYRPLNGNLNTGGAASFLSQNRSR